MTDMVRVIETERLYLRETNQHDFGDLCEMLQDESVMYAYEHAFSDAEVQEWLDKQRERYQEHGFGLWAVMEKASGAFVGQAGLTVQDAEGRQVVEIGYLLKKKYWHRGYATEAAKGCKKYAFNALDQEAVYSLIRENNTASQNVAKRLGMSVVGRFIKHYHGIDMPHVMYMVSRAARP